MGNQLDIDKLIITQKSFATVTKKYLKIFTKIKILHKLALL